MEAEFKSSDSSSDDIPLCIEGAADGEPSIDDTSSSSSDDATTIADAVVDVRHADKYEVRCVLVAPESRITSNIMTLCEYTECRSIRAEQIARYNNCFVSIEGLTDPIAMAERELRARMTPLILQRCVGEMVDDAAGIITKYYEEWRARDMGYPS